MSAEIQSQVETVAEFRKRLEGFQGRLNAAPNQNEVKSNPHAGNSLYLPISYVEMTLDELFFGLWETRDFRWQVAGNEIIGSILLRVLHPVANQWIERTGASATMIRLKKDSAVTDISAKIHNALEMDFPHLKADCIVNAAKSFGVAFGRDLNRKDRDFYQPIITNAERKANELAAVSSDNQEARDKYEDTKDSLAAMDFKQVIDYFKGFKESELGKRQIFVELFFERVAGLSETKEQLTEFYNIATEWQKTTDLTRILSKRKSEIEANGKS